MVITFKNAAIDDIDGIVELNKKLINKYETNRNLDFDKIFDWVKRNVEKYIESYQCIYVNEIKAGYFFLSDKGEKLELDDFYIFDEFQGQGIGTYVLKHVALISKEKNKAVFLYVFAENKGAIKLYNRNGYKIIENISDSRYIMSTE